MEWYLNQLNSKLLKKNRTEIWAIAKCRKTNKNFRGMQKFLAHFNFSYYLIENRP